VTFGGVGGHGEGILRLAPVSIANAPAMPSTAPLTSGWLSWKMAAHAYRKCDDGTWRFASIGGEDTMLDVLSVGVRFPLAELYRRAIPTEEAEPADAVLSFPHPGESV
jgi:hypothetical protein